MSAKFEIDANGQCTGCFQMATGLQDVRFGEQIVEFPLVCFSCGVVDAKNVQLSGVKFVVTCFLADQRPPMPRSKAQARPKIQDKHTGGKYWAAIGWKSPGR